jgi:hypothetical protein
MQSDSNTLLLVNCNKQSIVKNMFLPSEKMHVPPAAIRPSDGRKPKRRAATLASLDLPDSPRTVVRPSIGLRSDDDTLPRASLDLAGALQQGADDEPSTERRAAGTPPRALRRTVRVCARKCTQNTDTNGSNHVQAALPKMPASETWRNLVEADSKNCPRLRANDPRSQRR